MSQTPENRVSAADVRNVKFQLIRRGGYDPGQVDPFLEVIAQTLEGGPYADWRINGEYIHGVRFTTVRRGGYMPAQVDAFLDRVIDTFDAAASEGHHPSASTVVPEPAAPSPVAAAPEAAGIFDTVPPPPTPEPAPAPEPAPQPIAATPPPAPAPPPTPEPAPHPIAATPPPAPAPPPTPEPAPHPVAATPAPAPAAPPAAEIDLTAEADFERLRILHRSGVLSDKEFAVLGARVKRRINAQRSAVVG